VRERLRVEEVVVGALQGVGEVLRLEDGDDGVLERGDPDEPQWPTP